MIGLLLSLVFIFLNGFFVAAEFAFVKIRATQLTARAKKGERRAITASRIVERLDRYLSVTQFGITLASLGLGWIGEPAIETLTHGWVVRFGYDHIAGIRIAVIAVAFGLLTFAHVLFGELVPKLIAIQRTEQTALVSAFPLRVIYLAFMPLLWILERASRLILRTMGLSPDAVSEGTLSEDEIVGILAAQAARTEQGRDKVQLVERVLRFSQRTARHAMVPRVDVVFLPITTRGADAVKVLKQNQFSRVLLTKEKSLDAVEGYIYTKEFLLDVGATVEPELRRFRRDVLFVPEGQSLIDVLRNMQAGQSHVAVVVDEYGGTSGILTMEDLLEEIVGEIRDEFDEEPPDVLSVAGEPDVWDVNARVPLDELRAIGVIVDGEQGAETVGSVFFEKLGKLPKRGDEVEIAFNATATATQILKRRILRVRIRVKKDLEETTE